MRDTRSIIAEQAQRIIQGGDVNNDVQVTTDELEIYVDQAFGNFILQSYYQNREEGEHALNGTFIYSFVQEVKCDDDRRRYYCVIPSTYVNLPNNMGIYSVSPIQDEFNTYVPLPTSFASLTRGTLVGDLQGNKSYFVENTRLYLHNLEESDVPKKLLIKLAGGIQTDDDGLEVDIPLNYQSELVRMCVELYFSSRQTPKDQVTDNVK